MIGAVVLATEQGLGYLAKAFYDNGVIDKVYIKEHSTRKNHYEWFPNRVNKPEDLLDCESIIFFETAFEWKLIPLARDKGIKTILMVMYECTPNPLPYSPDIILCPSKLDLDYYKEGREVVVPVDVKWKKREFARVFVHNAGNGGLGGRNGTREVLEAMKYVQSPIKLIVRSQVPIKEYDDPRIEYRIGTFDDIWSEGDVFLFPEKFNGLSLPLQEAFASGMLVMAGDRYPINTWLPKEPLIEVSHYTKEKIAVEFDYAHYDPKKIAEKIDEWYNKSISEFSLLGKQFNKKTQWKNLKNQYKNLCTSSLNDQ